MAALAIRKNIYDLTKDELMTFRDAVNTLKTEGTYDEFVHRHHEAMMRITLITGETSPPVRRNSAHRGPAFLPWHRVFLRDFELALQEAAPDTGITLPYWDWAADAEEHADPKMAPLWTDEYIGGDGSGPPDFRVTDGPFTGWTVMIETSAGTLAPRPGAPGLVRRLGSHPIAGLPVLPDKAEVDKVFAHDEYDAFPWREWQPLRMRNALEGWASGPLNPATMEPVGVTTHNLVHSWVGGDMLPRTSPNDPVFFLNHCNVDRLWASWQEKHPTASFEPASGGPAGHNGTEEMLDLGTTGITPESVLDYRAMGYEYDTLD
jgi:tyrosinase